MYVLTKILDLQQRNRMTLSVSDIIAAISMIAGVGSFFVALSAKDEVKKLKIVIDRHISIKNVDKIEQEHHGDGNNQVHL